MMYAIDRMSGQYDRIIKETMRDVVDVLISKVMKIDVVSVTNIESKMQVTDEREADFLLRVVTAQGETVIIHIEFQLTNDADMVYRMLRYWCHMKQIHKLPVVQYVFYIGNKPLTMSEVIVEADVNYRYNLIDMRTLDCEQFLYSTRPKEMIISLLCNLQGKGAEVYLTELLQRIRDFVSEETLRSKYIKQIEVMSLTRDLQEYICKEIEKMALTYDIERDVRFRQGMEKGLAEGEKIGEKRGEKKGEKRGEKIGEKKGEKRGLVEGIELALDIKFGDASLALLEQIKKVDDIATLKKIKEHIRKSDSVADIMKRIR
ncbi:MAG: Rpn family recombination-promoting nuclease/putative transposase [Magnetococcales bacterium]|nr:Rpn family recombination-promoting nuclease/putative transposase [Nitrospirota bacterium]